VHRPTRSTRKKHQPKQKTGKPKPPKRKHKPVMKLRERRVETAAMKRGDVETTKPASLRNTEFRIKTKPQPAPSAPEPQPTETVTSYPGIPKTEG